MRSRIRYLTGLVFFLRVTVGISQVTVSGVITDKSGGPLPGATVKLLTQDSVFVTGASAGIGGEFSFSASPGNTYIIKVIYLSSTTL